LPGAGQVGAGNGALLQGYVSTIQAGAQRFVNARTFDMEFTVSHDFMDDPLDITALYDRNLQKRYMKTFNQLYGRKADGTLVTTTSATDQTSGGTLSAPADYWTHQVGTIGTVSSGGVVV
jgi:hypothetical protein